MPTWLTKIFSVVIILGIFAWIGLSIYQKIKQIRGKKKKKLKERRVINNVRYVFNNSV
uniref:Plectrovirus spv1-r8a2b orf 12 c-terminal truncated transmembrane protein n=1 Tax=Spiroplasma citri TaxID=2133 RepID=Q14NB3_SPICI|nr:plectrovirus spv1-r8a2b orf 12 c-terminal truncated transmembrane protein [Spiroplasma citri]